VDFVGGKWHRSQKIGEGSGAAIQTGIINCGKKPDHLLANLNLDHISIQ
jgi:hypothetical protein